MTKCNQIKSVMSTRPLNAVKFTFSPAERKQIEIHRNPKSFTVNIFNESKGFKKRSVDDKKFKEIKEEINEEIDQLVTN